MSATAGRVGESNDSFDCVRSLPGHPDTVFASLELAERHGAGDLHRLPYALRILAENLLRHEDGQTVTTAHIKALTAHDTSASIPFHPERILLQDASGLPVLADLVAIRERAIAEGVAPEVASPARRMGLVVDHAVEVDVAGRGNAAAQNLDREYDRHARRFRFLRWCETQLSGLRVVPPGVGICHQLNLEVLADVVGVRKTGGRRFVAFDTMIGTDSHSTMINALGVVGWGVGGIEATAAALGQPLAIRIPEVVGVRLTGRMAPGVLATDVALRLAEMLRAHGVVEKIVEFHGDGVAALSVADRATIANMAPEYGATMAYFPPDERVLDYLRATGRPASLAEDYLRAQNMITVRDPAEVRYTERSELDLSTIRRTMAGPARPH